jgi:hypothetical protein
MAKELEKQVAGFRTLKRVLRLFQQMSISESKHCRESIVVAEELYAFLQEWERTDSAIHIVIGFLSKRITGSSGDDSAILTLIDFLSKESAPGDVLRALVIWSSSHKVGDAMFARLDALLRRGVQVALKSELSGSLLRLRHARRTYTDDNRLALSSEQGDVSKTSVGIWRQMAIGALSIDK